jgi:site-specific DNA-cytosine methylase
VIIKRRKRVILDLCGGTGSWSQPYRDRGYEVHVVDKDPMVRPQYFLSAEQFLAHVKRGTTGLDAVHGILAAPPCTVFTNASSRLWPRYDEDERTSSALKTVKACLAIIDILKPKW